MAAFFRRRRYSAYDPVDDVYVDNRSYNRGNGWLAGLLVLTLLVLGVLFWPQIRSGVSTAPTTPVVNINTTNNDVPQVGIGGGPDDTSPTMTPQPTSVPNTTVQNTGSRTFTIPWTNITIRY